MYNLFVKKNINDICINKVFIFFLNFNNFISYNEFKIFV
jgi:hypothetical protein